MKVIRRMSASVTHVLDEEVRFVETAAVFIKPYTAIDGIALCGVHVVDGVVMQEGTTVRCPACKHLSKEK